MWTDIFNDDWFLSLSATQRAIWLQLIITAKLYGDTGLVSGRSWSSLGLMWGCDGKTCGKILREFQSQNKIEMIRNGVKIGVAIGSAWGGVSGNPKENSQKIPDADPKTCLGHTLETTENSHGVITIKILKYDYWQRLRRAGDKENSSEKVFKNENNSGNFPTLIRQDNIRQDNIISSNPSDVDQSIPDNSLNEDVKKVYDFYIKESGRNPKTYKLSKKRKQKIRARLKEFTIKQLSQAIQAVLNTPWNTGENPSGKLYIEIEDHIFRSYEQTEKRVNEYFAKYGTD